MLGIGEEIKDIMLFLAYKTRQRKEVIIYDCETLSQM